MPIYVNRTNAGKNQMPRAGFELEFDSVYIDRHIRVNLSDDEQCSKYAVLRTMCMVYTSGPMSTCLDDQQK